MIKVLVQCLFIFSYTAASPAINLESDRGIIFPTIDKTEQCILDERLQTQGICKKLSDCPTALNRWINENLPPKTCYFNKFDQIVCCESDNSGITQRRSELACSADYKPLFSQKTDVFRIQVVHGLPTKANEFPFMVALGWRQNFDDTISYKCGGALIATKFVLTAAHCATIGGDYPIQVRVGGVNLTESASMDIKIKRFISHPDYQSSSYYNDIALVELEAESIFKPACLWSQQQIDNTDVTAIGYGHTRFGGRGSDQLLKAPLKLVADNDCRQFYSLNEELRNGITDTQICAKDPTMLRDTCQGDSGGPIVSVTINGNRKPYIVGITSFGQGCAGGPPSVYTRTSAFIDWIEDIVWPTITI